jgi:hypothetical protein
MEQIPISRFLHAQLIPSDMGQRMFLRPQFGSRYITSRSTKQYYLSTTAQPFVYAVAREVWVYWHVSAPLNRPQVPRALAKRGETEDSGEQSVRSEAQEQ